MARMSATLCLEDGSRYDGDDSFAAFSQKENDSSLEHVLRCSVSSERTRSAFEGSDSVSWLV